MEAEAIAAFTAAGVAAAAVPATLVVGRWQVRAALRAAAHTARVGRSQAEASYRAALDAVQAQGRNERDQWRRGIRRDAYAAFLQSVLGVTEHAHKLHGQGLHDPLEVPAAVAASTPLITDMSQRNWVVRLEGPDEVSTAAQSLQDSAQAFLETARERAVWGYARALLQQQSSSHPEEGARIRALIPTVSAAWDAIGTPEFTDEANEALTSMRRLLREVGIDVGLLMPLVRTPDLHGIPRTHHALNEAIEAFLAAARGALHNEA
jgi:hypothetical protein